MMYKKQLRKKYPTTKILDIVQLMYKHFRILKGKVLNTV